MADKIFLRVGSWYQATAKQLPSDIDLTELIANPNAEYPEIEVPGGTVTIASTVTLTDAQIKNLPTIDFEVIQVPGVNKALIPQQAVFILDATAGAYTNVSVNNIIQFRRGGDYCPFPDETSGPFNFIWSDSSNVWFINVPYFDLGQEALVDVNNKNFTLNVDNSAQGNFTGGNAANTLKVTVYYVLVYL